ncbi:hypothetical protein FB45DRAFT_1056001 [Roridomyces roridus]|uniref:Uncharacterized protein n=1 Tax=Roridomyces roridus TaxID=1738132 RepID=A0AAD7FTJ4_9AGAR|nr:hypothetical protein FB45DRAFT_1056001 [Roridomyces roridus]
MFTFGLLEQGPRGIGHLIAQQEDEVADFAQFGVDWEAHGNPALLAHHAQHNPNARDQHPFDAFSTPDAMSEVVVEPPNCPFTAEQVALLDLQLAQLVDTGSRDMAVRKVVWKEALAICQRIEV